MELYREMKTDEKAEVDGVWLYLDDAHTAGLKVARWKNENFHNKLIDMAENRRIKTEKGKARLGGDIVRDADSRKDMCHVMAGTILVDWFGIEEDGEDVPFSEEKAEKYLYELKELLIQVVEFSDERANYLEANLKEAVDQVKK